MNSSGQPAIHTSRANILVFPPRIKQLLVPREHGSWGLWLLPLIAGSVVGAAGNSGHIGFGIFWFWAASAAAFLACQPLEALLGISPLKARTPEEKQLTASWVILEAFLCLIAVLQLMLSDRPLVLCFALLPLGYVSFRLLFSKVHALRQTLEIVGALALSSTAAASYYVISGKIDGTALTLWAASWLFAASQIAYVQLRMHAMTASSIVEKARAGWKVYVLHLILLTLATAGVVTGKAPSFFVLLFIPATVRVFVWAVSRPSKINFYKLGFSELLQSVVFTSLLIAAFMLHSG